MTPEAQRTAIAEACGWKTEYRDAVSSVTALPDYLNDLNAIIRKNGFHGQVIGLRGFAVMFGSDIAFGNSQHRNNVVGENLNIQFRLFLHDIADRLIL